MNELLGPLKNGIIVSCQSEGDDPFNHPDMLAKFAIAAKMGGAAGIRAQGVENVKAIRAAVDLPVIGIIKGMFENGWVCITPDFKDIDDLLAAGADIIALDATPRKRPNGMDGIEFFDEVRSRYQVPLMADIAIYEEGIRAAELGADIVATTLSGYTEYTESKSNDHPDFLLIEELSKTLKVPLIAEGRIWTPEDAKAAVQKGAYAVVVGTAITRPRVITSRFVSILK